MADSSEHAVLGNDVAARLHAIALTKLLTRTYRGTFHEVVPITERNRF
jgi:hypothetical protein